MGHRCDWCGAEVDKLQSVFSGGESYNLCSKCYTSEKNSVCRICGTSSTLYMYKGVCTVCSQDIMVEEATAEEERDMGVALEMLEAFSNGVEFTEEDFIHWMTFSQGTFSPAYLKRIKRDWLMKKLSKQGGWSEKLVEDNLADIEVIMERHSSKIIKGTYVLVYFNAADGHTKRLCVDQHHNIMLVEKSMLDKYSNKLRTRKKK